MTEGFAAALSSARSRIIHDPADAVVAVLMEEYGITEDPRENIGYQDDWYHQPVVVDMAIRVMVVGFGMTQTAAAERMGFTAGKAYRAAARGTLLDYELDLYDAASELLGNPR